MPAKGWKGFARNNELRQIKENLSRIDPKAKGSIAESYVCARLTELGFNVWLPYMNNDKVDLAVFINQHFVRIQVKSATFDAERERFRVMLTTRDREGKHIVYRKEDVDFFIVKCEGIPAFYIIPVDIGILHPSLNLYPQRDRVFLKSFDAEQYKDAFQLINGG